jgi:ABC-type glycerol-3-phosphate transport system permease component
MGNVPEDLYDASRIDGTSYTGFFLRVVLPLSKSIIAILTLFAVQSHWNTYMSAKIYIYSGELYTLQQVIQNFINSANAGLAELQATDPTAYLQKMREQQLLKYAIVIVSIIPLILIYPFIQKYLVKGVMVGAVKG